MAVAIGFEKLKRVTANIYSADFASFGATDAEELIGMAVTLGADATDLTTVKASPYLGTGAPVGWIESVTVLPAGYASTNGTWKTSTVTIVLAKYGIRVLAKAAIPAGSYVKYDTKAPVGVIAAATLAEAAGQLVIPAQINESAAMVIVPGFTQA